MTVLYIDSFDHYITSNINDKGWSSSDIDLYSIDDTGGVTRFMEDPLGAMQSSGFNIGPKLTRNYPPSDTVVVGCAWVTSSFRERTILELLDTSGNSLANLEVTSGGGLKLTSGGVVEEVSASVAGYQYYELKYTKGTGSNGFAEVRHQESIVLTITTSSETAQAAGLSCLEHGGASGGGSMDDLYILNGLGGSPTDDYLGIVRIDAFEPNGNGVDTDFDSSTGGANYTHVNSDTPDDGSWNESNTLNDRDLHTMGVSAISGTIFAIQPVLYAIATDAGGVSVDIISEKSGGAGEQSAGIRTLSTNNQFEYKVFDNDPDDDTTWTNTKIDATDFGYKVNTI